MLSFSSCNFLSRMVLMSLFMLAMNLMQMIIVMFLHCVSDLASLCRLSMKNLLEKVPIDYHPCLRWHCRGRLRRGARVVHALLWTVPRCHRDGKRSYVAGSRYRMDLRGR